MTDAFSPDQNQMHIAQKNIDKGELLIHDLGYFSQNALRKLVEAQAFFLGRFQTQTALYVKTECGEYKRLSLWEILKQQNLEPAQKAIALFERLGDSQRGNLAATLGDLANAYRGLGQLDAALEAAKRGLAINRDLGRNRGIAAGLGRIARILMQQQCYAEADARYTEALRAAEAAGDQELQGTFLQHLGVLQNRMGNYDRAVELYKQAITLFQRAADTGSEMRTCDLLASAEWQAKRDAKIAELRRLRRGEGADGQDANLPNQQLQLILALAQAAYAARASNSPLPPDAAEALAQLTELPPPFGAVGSFLQAIAAGQPAPSVPGDLPPEVTEILEALVESLEE